MTLAPEGRRRLRTTAALVGGVVVVGVATGGVAGIVMGALGLGALGASAARLRDASRTPPPGAASLVIAPVDGRVAAVVEEDEPTYVQGPATRVTIARSPLASRVQRAPADGVVEITRAGLPGSALGIRHASGLRLLLSPSPSAPLERVGESVTGGQRLGVASASRVDVVVARGVEVSARVGDVVRAGETVIGHFPIAPAGTPGTAADLADPPLVAGASTSGTTGA